MTVTQEQRDQLIANCDIADLLIISSKLTTDEKDFIDAVKDWQGGYRSPQRLRIHLLWIKYHKKTVTEKPGPPYDRRTDPQKE